MGEPSDPTFGHPPGHAGLGRGSDPVRRLRVAPRGGNTDDEKREIDIRIYLYYDIYIYVYVYIYSSIAFIYLYYCICLFIYAVHCSTAYTYVTYVYNTYVWCRVCICLFMHLRIFVHVHADVQLTCSRLDVAGCLAAGVCLTYQCRTSAGFQMMEVMSQKMTRPVGPCNESATTGGERNRHGERLLQTPCKVSAWDAMMTPCSWRHASHCVIQHFMQHVLSMCLLKCITSHPFVPCGSGP